MKKIIVVTLLLLSAGFVEAQKNLGIQGSPNFRELGGLETKNGQVFKEGMLFRSGSFPNLNEHDQAILSTTGINSVIDFRSAFEIENEPDFFPNEMNVNWINAPIGSLDQKGMSQFREVLSNPDFKSEDLDNLMIQANRGFVDHIEDFKPFFVEIQKPETIVLFHCSAGKDRTGFASSLLLHALGYDWEEILADFLTSNDAVLKADLSKMKMYGFPEDRAAQLMGVKASYLESSWKAVNEKYGSIDNMLEMVFGIGESEKELLRKKYLLNK